LRSLRADVTFANLERHAWQDPAVARAYSDRFPTVTGHLAEPVLDAAHVRSGDLILDIACGPGTVGSRAVSRGCRVVGVDLSKTMLGFARRPPTPLRPVLGSATRLPFRSGRLDATVSNFGLLHFPDPEAAIREAARVLRSGGRSVWSVWGEDAAAFRLIPESMRALGLSPELPDGPGFFRFGTPDRFATALEAAGLTAVSAERFAWEAPFPSADSFWKAFEQGSARTRAAIRSFGPDQRAALRVEVDRRLSEHETPSGLAVPTTAVVASGARP
jgi:SAM-dependent methyltransferase